MRRLCRNVFSKKICSTIVCSVVFLLASTLLMSCSGDDDYSFYASVSGTVVDAETGLPLPGVNVTITPENSSVMTTDNGVFEFTGLDSNQYTLVFQKSGYQTNRKNVSLEAGDELQIAVTLTKIP